MKTVLSVMAFAIPCLSLAQEQDSIRQLSNIEIVAEQVIQKPDGQLIFPSEVQKQSSTNGYTMLQKLALPNLRIDNASHSVSVIDNRGSVQLRINGIEVSRQEMMALDPKQIIKIDYIDNPGVRYGDEVAYVINFITRRADSGYVIGADLTPSLTSWQGEGMAYGKWNVGKNEISLSYDFNGHQLKGSKGAEIANYTLSDGSIYTMERKDIETLQKDQQHDLKLTYNRADSSNYVFQASISGSIGKTPDNYVIKEITDGINRYTATRRLSDNFYSPVIDLYFFRQLTPRQTVTANAVGTYISTTENNSYDEGTPYQYDVDGETTSLLSEVVYENRFKPFTLSLGLNYRFKNTKNDYLGSTSALTEMNQNNVYTFSQIKGSFNALRYSLGIGMSYLHYKQNEHRYGFWSFRPKATIAYSFSPDWQINYSFLMQERASRIAMISDAMIQTNSMEWTIGNPDLKPSRDVEHQLQLSYNNTRFQTFVQGFLRQCHKPNMAHYERTEDNLFIYTQINQKEIDLLHTMAYASYWLLPEKLQIACNGGLQRCFNFGFDYTHCYTSWFYATNIVAYLGSFTLTAYADNGSRHLEGETKGHSGAYTAIQASYMYRDWQFSLTWGNPLRHRCTSYESELLNRDLHKVSSSYSADNANLLSLNISWRMSKGRKYQDINKRINQQQDRDTGILK